MIITLSLKTPDLLDDVLNEEKYDEKTDEFVPYSEDEKYEIEEAVNKFVKYGECVTISIDTKTGEATVDKVEE